MEQLLTAKQVQKILGVSLALVYRLADRRQIPCVRWEAPGEGTQKPRTLVRFRQEDVVEFIESHYQQTT